MEAQTDTESEIEAKKADSLILRRLEELEDYEAQLQQALEAEKVLHLRENC